MIAVLCFDVTRRYFVGDVYGCEYALCVGMIVFVSMLIGVSYMWEDTCAPKAVERHAVFMAMLAVSTLVSWRMSGECVTLGMCAG
ncbi:DUF1686 domain-containing protein [Encephalitozoon hellem]|uniref:DUF1686 domain-containing protein n=2 Tax=Encephalitozoon hellem TaxID=27973 RepID=A0A9Q9C3H1_ENCHE|nr:hypothetical protein GPU96_07g12230 [Encephalitozoon hellem]WEL38939.1 DUF1686 domain-containing protein [Encephalitozoon hellem]WEL39550.1 DUF1686 domain-containing protein [Encephalitozoon hellem]WEL39758.1 DUF1686 domain-containing protein [Encephalitozoon hellem]